MLAVFDLDGVLADNGHRQYLIDGSSDTRDWDAFFAGVGQDIPLAQGFAAVSDALAKGWTPLYLSGRPEKCRAATEAWLVEHHFPTGNVVLRRDGDHRPATTFKRGALQRLARREQIALVVDDEPKVIEMASALGLPTQLADWANR